MLPSFLRAEEEPHSLGTLSTLLALPHAGLHYTAPVRTTRQLLSSCEPSCRTPHMRSALCRARSLLSSLMSSLWMPSTGKRWQYPMRRGWGSHLPKQPCLAQEAQQRQVAGPCLPVLAQRVAFIPLLALLWRPHLSQPVPWPSWLPLRGQQHEGVQ